MDYIYADYAATAPLMPEVLESMSPWMQQRFGNASSLSRPGTQARKAVEDARRRVAAALSARYEEIFFTSGGTESNVSAIRGVLEADGAGRLVCSAIEHHSVLNTVLRLRARGTPAQILHPDSCGILSPDAVAAAVEPGTLASIHYANNEIGVIEPAAQIAQAVHARGGLFHCDCVQAAGHIPLALEDSGIDLASFSAHKFGGPKGMGILYIRRGTPFSPLLTGGAQEWGMRAGTENVAGIVGLARALEISCAELESEACRLRALRAQLEEGVAAIAQAHSNVRAARTLPSLANFSFAMLEGENLATLMDQKGIAISPGSACAAGVHEPSHVLHALGLDPELALGSVRISLGRGTKASDIPRIVQALTESAAFLRYLNPAWRDSQQRGRV